METNILQFLASKSPLSTIPIIHTNPSTLTRTTLRTPVFLPRRKKYLRLDATNSTSSDDTPQPVPPPPTPTITPPDTVEIRFRRGSRKRSKRQKQNGVGDGQPVKAQATAPQKKWEDMNLSEKTIELYMGDKGLLFWLNKFAYASIFIVIGGWILFRFVGPSLNLYQLDTPPLSPSSIFKGS